MPRWPIEIPAGSPFTLDNIPFGVFSAPSEPETRVGAAIGEFIIDLSVLEQSDQLEHCFPDREKGHRTESIFARPNLNCFAALGAPLRRQIRQTLIDWLRDERSPLFEVNLMRDNVFVPMEHVQMHLPFNIGSFTDFMCSDVHVENARSLCSRIAGAPVPPSHYAMPLGYNSRASSVIIGDEPIYRPRGMIRNAETGEYSFLPSQKMDYEAELAFFMSEPVPMGVTITAEQAYDHIFGFVILNDWSARDIQLAEMAPLGPLNGKGFASSISPWVVTLDALQNARCTSTAADLSEGGTTRAAHLCHADSNATWNLEVEVSIYRITSNTNRHLISSRSNLRDLRWSPGQMLAHLASSGSGLQTGDLIGTGTISSPVRETLTKKKSKSPLHPSLGCLLELTEGGRVSIGSNVEDRLIWLEDGDEVVMTVRAGYGRLNFGTLRSRLLGPRPK
ncbi:putative 2-hydroxyhepta-2,4-diene-1,7-dioate isomerase [Phaeosphaeriaceae sp. PMI808]|nr:putative 2-hydroxyhepta-2,4-diene-1,7-dioate isomerase [Phaeosphaeriaceae sp. PMI808]